ncbi:corrinoid protein [Dethiobacter alkaliphilus]|uniref:corrinoid protein n=1 Tax=Dethiobacter alkaliphilus TaxID=427926 RepID=UPI002225C48A|nr:corrinoid protein [Dethiobacter alkaliphilus]MCW3489982.1 corrinoid protein [Dethiobacter alkaliphilus]
MSNYEQMKEALKQGNADGVKAMVEAALNDGATAKEVVDNGLIAGILELGVLFKNNEVYIPEVLMAARALHTGLDVVKLVLAEQEVGSKAKIVLGTVKADLHDIGKNLVGIMLEGSGFEVVDLGIDVPSEKFVEAVREEKPAILALSALLTTTMPYVKEVIELLKESGLRDSVKVIVGGAPVTQEFADQIGADGYAPDAGSATALATSLVN